MYFTISRGSFEPLGHINSFIFYSRAVLGCIDMWVKQDQVLLRVQSWGVEGPAVGPRGAFARQLVQSLCVSLLLTLVCYFQEVIGCCGMLSELYHFPNLEWYEYKKSDFLVQNNNDNDNVYFWFYGGITHSSSCVVVSTWLWISNAKSVLQLKLVLTSTWFFFTVVKNWNVTWKTLDQQPIIMWGELRHKSWTALESPDC